MRYWDDVCRVLQEAELGRRLADVGQCLHMTTLIAAHVVLLNSPIGPDPELSPEEMAGAIVGLVDHDPLVDAEFCDQIARDLWAPVPTPGTQIYYGPAGHGLSCDCRACEVPTARSAS